MTMWRDLRDDGPRRENQWESYNQDRETVAARLCSVPPGTGPILLRSGETKKLVVAGGLTIAEKSLIPDRPLGYR